jgi:hypothetical protein
MVMYSPLLSHSNTSALLPLDTWTLKAMGGTCRVQPAARVMATLMLWLQAQLRGVWVENSLHTPNKFREQVQLAQQPLAAQLCSPCHQLLRPDSGSRACHPSLPSSLPPSCMTH